MKNSTILIFVFIVSLFFSCKNQLSKNTTSYTVSGKVLKNKLYCGGARPTEKMIEDLKIPIAYSNKSFYIKSLSDDYTNQKTVLNFVSDSLGEFSFKLKPGSYAIFLEEQINKVDVSELKNQEMDQGCYDKWLKVPFSTIEIEDDEINSLVFEIKQKCFITKDIPCLNYTGPRPQ